MTCVLAARGTENAADSCANDDDIMNDGTRFIFSMLEICNKHNNVFPKASLLSNAYCWSSLHIHL